MKSFKDYLKEAEQIDELSKDTLGSYIKKASGAEQPKNVMSPKNVPLTKIAAYQGDSETGHFGKRFNQHTYDKAERLRKNRETGITTAVDKLTKESSEDGRDKFYYQRNNIWRVMDGDDLVYEYKPERNEIVGAKKLLARFDDEGYDVDRVISPMGTVTYLYGKPEDEIDEGAGGGIVVNGKEVDPTSLEVDGIHTWDAPDFSDAYFSAAYFTDGTDLTDEEMDELTSNYGDLLYDKIQDRLHESDMSVIKDRAGVKKSDVPAHKRKNSGDPDWKVSHDDLKKEREQNASGSEGLAALKKRMGMIEDGTE